MRITTDVVDISTGTVRAEVTTSINQETGEEVKGVKVVDSYRIHTPMVRLYYAAYLNYMILTK